MATRFYFPFDTAADVAPVANGTWDDTDETLNRQLSFTKSGTAMGFGSIIDWTTGQTCLDRRYISDPIAAMTLNGTVKMQLACLEVSGSDNVRTRIEVYVVSNNGGTVRGTLLSGPTLYGPDTELSSTGRRNKTFISSGTSITEVTTQNGDRIVVCIGYTDVTGSGPETRATYGDTGNDLPENETDTNELPGWIEFSASISEAVDEAFLNNSTFKPAYRLSSSFYALLSVNSENNSGAGLGSPNRWRRRIPIL